MGTEVELVLDTLYEDDEHEYLVWKWRPVLGGPATGQRPVRARRSRPVLTTSGSPSSARACTRGASGAATSSSTGWPPPATRSPTPASPGPTSSTSPAPTPSATATPASWPGATFAQALGWTGARVSSAYAACASGAQAIDNARAQILAGLCDVALVVGADTTPKGFFAPVGGERKDDPDWLRFHLLGATNPTYFALYARRRMELFGATERGLRRASRSRTRRHGLANPNARYRKEVTAEEVLASPMVADPLRLLEICATSDGGAALVLSSLDFARRHGRADRPRAPSTPCRRSPRASRRPIIEMPNFSTDSAAGRRRRIGRDLQAVGRLAAYEEAGIGPEDVDLAEVYDLSSALELDWYEDIGLCKEGEAERLLRDGDTAVGGRVPVNPSGGLSCFGEAIPAQAIAQVCELVWQLRGRATGARSKGRGSASPRTRVCSVTAPRSSSRADPLPATSAETQAPCSAVQTLLGGADCSGSCGSHWSCSSCQFCAGAGAPATIADFTASRAWFACECDDRVDHALIGLTSTGLP